MYLQRRCCCEEYIPQVGLVEVELRLTDVVEDRQVRLRDGAVNLMEEAYSGTILDIDCERIQRYCDVRRNSVIMI
jgi:hypothetical protein